MVVNKPTAAAALAGAALLCAINCAPPARFAGNGTTYPMRAHPPSDIAVFTPPDKPGREYKVVGAIVVPRNRKFRHLKAYQDELRRKAAELGVDGVTNLRITTDGKRQATGGCSFAPPFYREHYFTLYEIRGDAFVWDW